jgi:hypothetical protein
VGRAAKTAETGTSGRLAASRRKAWNERGDDRPAPAGKAKSRGKAAPAGRAAKAKGNAKQRSTSSPSLVVRFFRLVSLLACMAVLGFALVLVADVGLTLVGGMRFGQITFAQLFDKVQDRVLDRDVPKPVPKAAPRKAAPPVTSPATPSAAPTTERAPEAAPRPDEYAKHLEQRPDPEVEAARDRLNDLLKRL